MLDKMHAMSIAGIELITRNSLNSLRHASQGSNYLQDTLNNQPTDDRSWSWGYLRRQFRNKNLDELYYQYQQRLQHGYFSVFLLLQILLTVGHIAVVIAAVSPLTPLGPLALQALLAWVFRHWFRG
uniref:Uncharacterized protein n=1 Tax=Timema monikensis TaxID=170555 RepID=A0A7R9HQA9_9NEOP|nr:unnamed protein product [Timema monikensis]